MKVYHSIPTGVGVAKVMQPLPNKGLRQISPFLLLHHIGPILVEPGSDALGVGSHPHRGFEPVTFLFEGGLEHKDSMGNIGHLGDGDVQWMTAGSGVLHSEHSTKEFKKSGGWFHMVQLWINLPKKHKMTEPRYQDMRDAEIPRISLGTHGSYARLIAGIYDDQVGPADTFTPLNAFHVIAQPGDSLQVRIEPGYNTFVYMLTGSGSLGPQKEKVVRHQIAVMDQDISTIAFSADEPSEFIIMSGEPIDEPMSSYGPFVMNTPQELQEAIRDFQMGKMGVLEE
ncbi:MAG: pirin family protein [Bacteroidia bacterium]|nr:pirin family protein [Bacteroidia bacterium]